MRPRLLFIVGRFVIGGHASDNISLLYHLREKYVIRMVYGEKEADEIEPLFLLEQYAGLDLQKLPSLKRSINPFADLVTLYRVYKCIKRFKPDIVHTHGAKSGMMGRVAAWLWDKPAIVHTFHGHLFHSYFNKLTTKLIIGLERTLSLITDAAIALSPSQKQELIEKFKIYPAKKVFEIPLGLFPPGSSSLYAKDFRKKYHLKEEDVAIGIIGRIVPIKNHIDFLKIAVSIVEKGFKHVKFFIIGDGAGRLEMTDFLQQHNLSFSLPENPVEGSQFVFTSWINNMYEVIYELDIITLTSLNEGTPVSLIEAQLCGKPVVSYDVGGVKDTFVDNVSGYLVDKGDISSFAEKVAQLIEDEGLRLRMGEKGREFSVEKFSKFKEVASIDNLYQTLLSNKKHVTKKVIQ